MAVQLNASIKEFLNLWSLRRMNVQGIGRRLQRLSATWPLTWHCRRILVNGAYAHGGCQVNGPKVAKFLDR